MSDLTVIIATLFDPPTLGPLVAAATRAGASVDVVRGMRTNAAWNAGIARCSTRYAMILNDDIEMLGEKWVSAIAGHFAHGDTWIGAAPAGGVEAAFNVPIAHRLLSGTTTCSLGEPLHKGQAFAMDLSAFREPVPSDLELNYGDDWFYWNHRRVGRAVIAMNAQYITGNLIPSLSMKAPSGWTFGHPRVESFLGESTHAIGEREAVVASKYFRLISDKIRVPLGLLET